MGVFGNLKIFQQNQPTEDELKSGDIGPKLAEAAFYIFGMIGPGFSADIYKDCFREELKHNNMPFEEDVAYDIEFRGADIGKGFEADFVVAGEAMVFILAEEKSPIHNAQIRAFLKLSGLREAYFINFRVPDMREGIMRAVVSDISDSGDDNVLAMRERNKKLN